MTVTRERVIVAGALIGLVVLTIALAYVSLAALGAARIIGYQHTGDDRKIVVVIATGIMFDVADREVKEDSASVRVTVHVRSPSGTVPGAAIVLPVLVTLKDGLGQRLVFDQDGKAVRDLGTYQLPGSP